MLSNLTSLYWGHHRSVYVQFKTIRFILLSYLVYSHILGQQPFARVGYLCFNIFIIICVDDLDWSNKNFMLSKIKKPIRKLLVSVPWLLLRLSCICCINIACWRKLKKNKHAPGFLELFKSLKTTNDPWIMLNVVSRSYPISIAGLVYEPSLQNILFRLWVHHAPLRVTFSIYDI